MPLARLSATLYGTWYAVVLPSFRQATLPHTATDRMSFRIGISVGLASCIAPLYIQELSPARLRRRMVVLNVVMITLGQVIAYGIDAGFVNVSGG